MPDAADDPCSFRWVIPNPLVPWKNKEATFYNESPVLTQWQVTLHAFVPREINRWPFGFSLYKIQIDEHDNNSVTAQLQVSITFKERLVRTIPLRNHTFSIANRFRFECSGTIGTIHLPETPSLTVEVSLYFPDQFAIDQETGEVPSNLDLRQLSTDLRQVFEESLYSNLILLSKYPSVVLYRVHTYIIRARWSNLFSDYPVEDIANYILVVNMSNAILREVLIYMYTGVVNKSGPILQNEVSRTELFQVIDRWKIHHLYKAFVADRSCQKRTTNKQLIIKSRLFRMDRLSLDHVSIPWTVNEDTDSEIDFFITFNMSADPPQFYYTLRSDTDTIFVLVHLQFVRRFDGAFQTPNTVYWGEHKVDFTETIESGICRFRGNADINNRFFDGIHRRGQINRSIKHYIRCIIYTSNGATVIDIKSERKIPEFQHRVMVQTDIQRLGVLSDHMYGMWMEIVDPDLRISCPEEVPGEGPDFPNQVFYLHRSMFASRIPHWRSVLEPVEHNNLPNEVTCRMTNEAFRCFGAYIYSSKVIPTPYRCLEELQNFAERGGLRYLSRFVLRKRMRIEEDQV